jgi:hypothetical protein
MPYEVMLRTAGLLLLLLLAAFALAAVYAAQLAVPGRL